MSTLLKKLLSRKFWAALIGIITGLAMVFGLDQNIITTVAGAVTAIASVVAYIVTEGKIDVAAAHSAAGSVSKAVDAVKINGE